MSLSEAPVFEALIAPHRSLPIRGVFIVVGVLTVLTVLIALRFWLWGAWPVLAFSLVEIPLLVALLAINYHQARASELIMLDTTRLTVIRTDPAGRRRQDSLQTAWLRVDLNATDGVPRILLSSHGRHCEVGAFLHEPDKVSLCDALKAALYRVKNPRFDNAQLREDR
jgi:uncharacterized membrane protein